MASAMYATRAEQWFAERKAEDRHRLLLILVGVAIMAMYPIIDKWLGLDLLGEWIPILVYVILAMGLNVVVGFAGLLDLGYVAFFVIGAYGNAFLTSPNSFFVQKGWVPEFLQSFWPAMCLSWILAAIFGLILGAPTLRLRGDYLAIVTLGFGEIVPDFFTNAETITNGPIRLPFRCRAGTRSRSTPPTRRTGSG
jgi:ABC-type branched-subunit amino acid transport system permease subunit